MARRAARVHCRPGEIPPRAIQRRAMVSLVGSQMLGGVGTAAGIAVGSIVAAQLVGSAELAGLANTAQVLGAALLTAPMARLMARRGRRVGLTGGYLVGATGAVLAIVAAVIGSFPVLLAGTALFGGASASSGQARYAATDLAEPAHAGRALSTVVWATTVGAVLGPNLLGPSGRLAQATGLPTLSGPFIASLAGFLLAALLITIRMRPDPLVTAQRMAGPSPRQVDARPAGSIGHAIRVIARNRAALIGAASIVAGHVVMVSIMVMTPLQMHAGGASLRVVGLVVSIHILGMYALSPAVGLIADRVGPRLIVIAGALLLLSAAIVAGLASAGWSTTLTVGLFLLGLGWSFTLTAGSTMLTNAVPITDRPGVQGFADIVMGLAAAGGSALAGVVVGAWGFGWLCAAGAVIAAALAIAAAVRHRVTDYDAVLAESAVVAADLDGAAAEGAPGGH